MKNKLSLLVAIVLIPLLLACEKESVRIDNYLVEYATVNVAGSTVTFKLDDGKILMPETTADKLDVEDGVRVILNYTPLDEDGFIKVNRIQKIFMDVIKEEGFPEELKTSPIKIVTIWVSGQYLNMSFEVDYHSKPHVTGLYRDMEAAEPTLYFSYSREDDPPGAPTLTYLSFDLNSLKRDIPFTMYVNTYDGVREFTFRY